MTAQDRVFVGPDVSKERLDVHVLGGGSFAVTNSEEGLSEPGGARPNFDHVSGAACNLTERPA